MSLQAQLASLISAVGADIKSLFSRSVPSGGTAGQALVKVSSTSYDFAWGTISASVTPGGSANQLQYNSAGSALAGAANVYVDSGDLRLAANESPVTPSAGSKIFAAKFAGRTVPWVVDKSGKKFPIFPDLSAARSQSWQAINVSTTLTYNGMASGNVSGIGTSGTRTVATTNHHSRAKRMYVYSSATAGNFGGSYFTTASLTVGVGDGSGGFFSQRQFAISDAAAVSGARFFCGLSSSVAAPTNVEPSTLTNSIGVAQLSTDSTQLYLVYGGSAAQAAIALGTGFPPMASTGATGGIVYTLTLYSSGKESKTVYYRLERMDTNAYVEGSITATTDGVELPATTTLLTGRIWRCNNATALAVAVDLTYYIHIDQPD